MKTERRGGPRALFYSHDTLGLGHLRRTLLLCEGLNQRLPALSMLVVTGSAIAHGFRIPPGVDYIKLPCVTKLGNENYDSRSLSIPFSTTWSLREQIIHQTAVNYRPDYLFVDNVPLGMKGEMVRTLDFVREHLPGTRVFLILRDILDDQNHVISLWNRLRVFEAIEKYYDRVLIFGQPDVFDPVSEYEWPRSIRRKTAFCGYIPRQSDRKRSAVLRKRYCNRGTRFVMVTVGGGSDGVSVIEAYLEALPDLLREADIRSLVLLGPEMNPSEAKRLRLCRQQGITFKGYCDDPLSFMDAADVVVTMAGYNTISEVLALRKKAIAVPRVYPRTEQLIRSQRLHDLGLLRMIHPSELNPQRLAREVLDSLRTEPPAPGLVQFSAFEKLSSEIDGLAANAGREVMQ